MVAAVLAAGRGTRYGADKALEFLGGKPLFRWSFERLLAHPRVDAVGLIGSSENLPLLREAAPEACFVAEGGATRTKSSQAALRLAEADIVLIHDAARPFPTQDAITRVLDAIERSGAAACCVPVSDTIRQRSGELLTTIDRSTLFAMQTPQGGRRDLLLDSYARTPGEFTDEMAMLEAAGVPFEIVEGDEKTFKITTPADMQRALSLIGAPETRTGLGYDIHPFSADPQRPMWLGGVQFDPPGLAGHSDADVVLHAVVDALLGAAGLGDIGQMFPNTDPTWKDRRSTEFVMKVRDSLKERNWRIVNVDVSVIAETPKIMPRAHDMCRVIAECLLIEQERVNVKATTNERLGSLGRSEGIAAFAAAQIARP